MSGPAEFVAALADALGPLYRVSLLGAKGEVESTFGGSFLHARKVEIPLPDSARRLLLEIDISSIHGIRRTLASLAMDPDDPPSSEGGLNLDRAMDQLISQAEGHIGRGIAEMTRAQKQQLVRFLDERGAFTLRKSVEMVADALGVSRFTVYNYLDSSREG